MRHLLLAALSMGIAYCAHADAPPATCDGQLRLAAEGEPGTPMRIVGRIHNRDAEPAVGARARFAQTDASGYYRKGADGRELGSSQARLSGELCVGADGRYRVETIRPGVYAHGGPRAHVHIQLSWGDHPAIDRSFEVDDVCTKDDAGQLVCALDLTTR